MFRRLLLVALSLVATCCGTAKADFYVQVENAAASVTAGNPVTLGVWGYYDLATPSVSLTGWTLGFQVTGVGATAPQGPFSAVNAAYVNPLGNIEVNNLGFTPVNYQIDVNATGGTPLTITGSGSANRVKLFDLTFNYATEGTFNLAFVPNAQYDFLGTPTEINVVTGTPGFSNPNIFANSVGGFAGQFTITAVPEPSSLALVGLVGFGMGLYRRRRS